MPRTVHFTLKDADGADHAYECQLHPPGDGQPIMWRLVGMAAGPLAAALKSAIPIMDFAAGRKLTGIMDDPAFMESAKGALTTIDMTSVGSEVQRAIATNPMSDLTKAILSRTSRDGKRLENPIHFDAAYEGNYGEMMQALWQVVTRNRFLPVPTST